MDKEYRADTRRSVPAQVDSRYRWTDVTKCTMNLLFAERPGFCLSSVARAITKVPPLDAGHPVRRDSTTEIYSVSFPILTGDTRYSPCSSPTLLSSIYLFGRRAIARCASLSDESMLLSLHALESRAAHSLRIALVMSKVGSTDAL